MEPIAVIWRKCEHCGDDILRYACGGKAKLTKKTTRFLFGDVSEKSAVPGK
jgi:hypothetical protein